MLFKYFNMASQSQFNDPSLGSPVTMISRRICKWLITVGLIFFILGVLVITYPEVFALLAACFMFFISAVCVIISLKILLSSKLPPANENHNSYNQCVDVDVSDAE